MSEEFEVPSVEGFIEFCEAQPDDRPINQQGTFDDCAIGDYLREECGVEDADGFDPDFLSDKIGSFLGDPRETGAGDSYGELAAQLQRFK